MVHAHRPPPSTRFLSSAVERDTSNVEVSRSNRLGSSSFCVCCRFVLGPVTFACLLPVAQRLNFGALGMGRGQVPVPLPSNIHHQRSRGLVVLTLDFESNNRRFDPGRDLKLSFFLLGLALVVCHEILTCPCHRPITIAKKRRSDRDSNPGPR